MKVSELPEGSKIMELVDAHAAYQEAVMEDGFTFLPYPQVFYNELTKAVIIILAETHSSSSYIGEEAKAKVQEGAAAVAECVMAIPNVKIAVEEPIEYNGRLLSNVGWGKGVTTKSKDKALFDFEATAQGSISHQIYVKQIEGALINDTRYAAENMVKRRDRYKEKLGVNEDMVAYLVKNTGAGEISVFPVGPDHVSNEDYHPNTLEVLLKARTWKKLENE